jgi:phosphinothricin acetyltransferase
MTAPLVRPGCREDLPALTDIYNYYVLNTAITFDIAPSTIESRAEWLSHYHETGPHRLLVAEVDGVVAGYATSSKYREKPAYATSIETSIYLDQRFAGQGIGSLLYTALFAALRDEDVHRAYAGITLPNPASIALHKRFGFTSVGVYHEVGRKFGIYHNTEVFAKRLNETEVP